MPSRLCSRHGRAYACTCAMGNLSRFVEPIVLLLLRKKGHSYGYDLAGALQEHALTDAKIEQPTLHRTLRELERNGNVVSEWDVETSGPARPSYLCRSWYGWILEASIAVLILALDVGKPDARHCPRYTYRNARVAIY